MRFSVKNYSKKLIYLRKSKHSPNKNPRKKSFKHTCTIFRSLLYLFFHKVKDRGCVRNVSLTDKDSSCSGSKFSSLMSHMSYPSLTLQDKGEFKIWEVKRNVLVHYLQTGQICEFV